MKKTLIIAEAGVNHNGNIYLAKKLIDIAVNAKVDIVKFQTAIPELVVSKNAQKAEYQKKHTGEGSQVEMLKKIHFPLEIYYELKNYCDSRNIKFLSSPFDHVSIDFLYKMGMDIFKIPSGEVTNKPFLQHIGGLNKEIILSTGLCYMDEIKRALDTLVKSGTDKSKISVLHCNTEYPTPMRDVNLNAMMYIKNELNVKVGYSDHTIGIEVPIAAVALGAEIIEKHFTTDNTLEGPDHKVSLNPGELKQMVSSIRNIEKALGKKSKKPTASELKNSDIVRRSIHVHTNLKRGHILTATDLIMKRPGNGISPYDIEKVIGKTLKSNIEADTMLLWKHIV